MTNILINSRTNAVLESLGENTRWLVENSAVADRAYADMMAEKAAQSREGSSHVE